MASIYEAPALVVLGTVLDLTEGCDFVFTSVTGAVDNSFGAVGCS
jgi:hypothetical protein